MALFNSHSCPQCGSRPELTNTEFGPRWSCCGLWAWCNAPLVDAATHTARRQAHEAFDTIWKTKKMTRGRAYAWLAKEMNMRPTKCHIKIMSQTEARRVIQIARKFLDTQTLDQ
jgi:hypothetical protein